VTPAPCNVLPDVIGDRPVFHCLSDDPDLVTTATTKVAVMSQRTSAPGLDDRNTMLREPERGVPSAHKVRFQGSGPSPPSCYAASTVPSSFQRCQLSTKAASSKRSRGRDGVLSSSNVTIEVLNLAMEISGIASAKDVFSSVGALLTMVRARFFPIYDDELRVHIHPGSDGQIVGSFRTATQLSRIDRVPRNLRRVCGCHT